MPLEFELREEGHILYFRISDPWTLADLLPTYPIQQAIMDKATHKVHTLINLMSRKFPPDVLKARETSPGLFHPNAGTTVVVDAPIGLQNLIEIMFRLTHFTRGKFFKTEEEGWSYLRQLIASEMP